MLNIWIDGKVNIGKKSPKKGNCLPQRSCFPFYMQITIAIFRYCHTDSFSDGSAQSAALLPFIGGPRKFLLTGCRICCILMTKLRLIGQAAKTPPSHGGNRGSIPLQAVNYLRIVQPQKTPESDGSGVFVLYRV